MNTAVRTFPHVGGIVAPKTTPFVLALTELRIVTLLMLILISAIAAVYIKDWNRRLFIQDQNLLVTQQNLEAYNNKLALEKGALSTPARIQQMAENSFDMQLPNNDSIVVIKANDKILPNNPVFAENKITQKI